jgi:hypothetical protein
MAASLMTRDQRGLDLGKSDEWETPARVFRACSRIWGPFLWDLAAALWNRQCERFYSERDNALTKVWRGRCWLNSPYSRGNLLRWSQKALDSVVAGTAECVCMLVPSYTSERWFQDVVRKQPGAQAPGYGPVLQEVGELMIAGLGHGFRRVYRLSSSRWLCVDEIAIDGRLRFRHRFGKQDSARHPSSVVCFSQEPAAIDGHGREVEWIRTGSASGRELRRLAVPALPGGGPLLLR